MGNEFAVTVERTSNGYTTLLNVGRASWQTVLDTVSALLFMEPGAVLAVDGFDGKNPGPGSAVVSFPARDEFYAVTISR